MFNSFLIALGLNFDTFSVSLIEGTKQKKINLFKIIPIAFVFGLVQGLFAFIGSLLGLGFKNIISGFDHWVAFIILFFVGYKMIAESNKQDNDCKNKNDFGSILALSIATSIDAIAVGITLPFLNIILWQVILIIGLMTFFVSLTGLIFGKKLCLIFKSKTKIIGGLILIGIGIKILLSHILV